jgi:hypothetical protein
MSKDEYYELVKNTIKQEFNINEVKYWNDPRWQRIISNMYERFASYTPEQQERLINSAGPKEPFWDRVVMDAAYAYYMTF